MSAERVTQNHAQYQECTLTDLKIKINQIVQVHLNKLECREKVFSCNLFQKVTLSYILDW